MSELPAPEATPRPVGQAPHRFIDSANFAIEGILHAASTEKHMRWHFISALLLLLSVLFLRVTPLEFALLTVSVCFVLFAELVNTAIEAVVDLVSPGYHPLAKTAKDVAAGSVLVSAIAKAENAGWTWNAERHFIPPATPAPGRG